MTSHPTKLPSPPDFIRDYQDARDRHLVEFLSNGEKGQQLVDENLAYRRAVIAEFDAAPQAVPLELVAALYRAETELARDAFGVHSAVRRLGTELLERGRARFANEYLIGRFQSMDTYMEAARVSLSHECVEELLRHVDELNVGGDDAERDRWKTFAEFLRAKL